MKIKLHNRRDQFSYFLGYVSRHKERFLTEALSDFSQLGYDLLQTEDVFECCPFNDSLEECIRAFHIFENSSKAQKHLSLNIKHILDEFVFLASDYAPDCCEDGRFFYYKSEDGQVFMRCNRCFEDYNLDAVLLHGQKGRQMTRGDFVELFGEDTEADWPYLRKLKHLNKKK